MSVNVTRVVKFRRKPVVLRGPQAWSDCAVGYPFECGAEGEEWKDVVIYGDNWYSCVKSHAKTPTNYPGSSEAEANGYWRLADKIEMVATKILLAQYALVKNLGVECVDMKNQFGVSVFRAKDGEVICRKGTFYNAVIRGLTVSALTNEICTSKRSIRRRRLLTGKRSAFGGVAAWYCSKSENIERVYRHVGAGKSGATIRNRECFYFKIRQYPD